MATIGIASRSGGVVPVEEPVLAALGESLAGPLLAPGDAGYDAARTVWNAMIDRRPAVIARCRSTADVARAVDFAREHGLLLAVRGGGHNIAGNAVCDGGIMVDLSGMSEVTVDADARLARVGPGATLGQLDAATQAFGLATPVGINSTTGVAGLTLGGGFGWLSRKHGLTVDNLVGAEVVTAAGEVVEVGDGRDDELFWGLRGGGGNFGVVTRFDLRLHPVGPDVYCGLVVYPGEQAAEAIRRYRGFAERLPDEAAVWVVLRKAPPLPFLPGEVHGRSVAVFAVFHAGDADAGRERLEPVRHFGTALGEHLGVMPFTAWQQAFDPLLTPGARNYWKSHNLAGLSDEAIDLLVRYAEQVPSPHCEIFLGQLAGAVNRVPADATAYPHRDAAYVVNVHGRWETAGEDARGVAWAREFHASLAPHATGGVYVNFMTEEEGGRVRSAYGAGWERLVQLKRRYDPHNVFSMNQNIGP